MSYYLRELIELRREFMEAYNSRRLADAMERGGRIIDLYKENNAGGSEAYAEDINNLAVVYDDVHINDRAKELYREAAKIRRDLLGEHSTQYLETMTNLGVLLSGMGEYAEAEEILKMVKNHTEENEGSNSSEFVDCLYNLGNMYADSEKYNESIETLSLAMDCAKRVPNYELEDFLDIHVSLADVCRKSGNYRRAREEYDKALKISSRIDDEDSYFKMTYFLNAALVYQQAELYPQAAEIYEKALEIRERLMDTKHLDFISVLNNLAIIYNRDGQYQKAVKVHERVLSLVESMLGRDHVFYADVITSLGVDYCVMGDFDKSLKYHNDALEMKKRVVGEKHPHYVLTLTSLADVYEKMEKYDRAIEIQNTALELNRYCAGEVNDQVSESLVSLGRLYMKKGDIVKAQGFFMQALIMNKEIIVKEGVRIKGYAKNIRLMAETCCIREDAEKTEQFCESLLSYRKSIYGDRHPKYARALYDCAELLIRLGLYAKADGYLEQAADIAETMLGSDTLLCRQCVYMQCRALFGKKEYTKASDKLKKAASLFKKYHKDENELIRIMFLQARTQYILGFPKKAEEIIFRAEGMASRNSEINCMAEEKTWYAQELESCGEHQKAAEMLEEIYPEADKSDKKTMYKLLSTLSKALCSCGSCRAAAKRAEEAEKYTASDAEKTEIKIILAKALIKSGEYEKAEEILCQALEFISKDTDSFVKNASLVYCLLGEACALGGKDKKALEYFESGLSEAKARQNLPTEEYCAFLTIASDTAKKLGSYSKATEYLSEHALIVRRDLGETIDFADILMKAAQLYLLQDRYDDAVTMLDKSAEIYGEFYGHGSDKYIDTIYEACAALKKGGKSEELSQRLEKMEDFGQREKDFSDLLKSAYKSSGAIGKLVKLKFGKNK